MTLRHQLAARAEEIVGNITQTDYRHVDNIDSGAGVYECDCSGFVGFVLSQVAQTHYREIVPEPGHARPRAFVYYDFFAALGSYSPGGWSRIDRLADADRGDVIAWRFPGIEVGEDTGHVLIVAQPAVIDRSGTYDVRVYDSTATPHFFDTRGDGAGQFPTGVGSGIIKFRVDADGWPISFLFTPPVSAVFSDLPIAIGRIEATG
jgi:hypothetical protein